jgi:hypothetical protein
MKTISVVKDYTRFPAGRYRSDGPFSGERFREELLEPSLREESVVVVQLDGVAGYGSSFLDEAFGGLIRGNVLDVNNLGKKLKLESVDESLIEEIKSYMEAT